MTDANVFQLTQPETFADPLTEILRNGRSSGGRGEEVVYRPDDRAVAHSQLTAFRQWCEARTGQNLPDHAAMDRFSVKEFRSFWRLFLEWCELPREGAVEPVCVGDACKTARFFPNLRLNYTECLLAGSPDQPVLTACHGGGSQKRFTRGALRVAVAGLASSLQRLGVRRGDHVAAIARNNAEVVIAALATAAVGATFASCAPDMGVPAILARFASLDPVVLFGCLGAKPWDSGAPVAERVAGAAAGLPSLAAIVALDNGSLPVGERTVPLHRLADLLCDAVGDEEGPGWLRYPFNQPLFTMFSSGTTGPPKCIQHGAGGTLLEHVKEHRLHCDLAPGDKLFFQTSCGWMMWNWQLSALASGVELVLYDGPLEGPDTFWRIVAEEGATVFGTNPGYLHFCEQRRFSPRRAFDLSALRAVLSTGSILYPRQYDWVRDEVNGAVSLQSISGGTDIIGCFVLGNPNLPIHRGEIQCRSLGLDVRSLPPPDDPEAGIGELVCANPFPSRPLGFHGDADGTRFHAAYFAQNPGFWTHGDLIEATPQGGWRLHGRSDGVLNVRGIRIGTAEIYRILDSIEEIREAMAVEQQAEEEAGGSRMILLVVLREGLVLDDMLAKHIRSELVRCGSPAFAPARIAQVAALPLTFSGKRSEAAARDAVNGRPVRNRDALQNPECLKTIANHPVLRAPPAIRASHGPAPAGGVIPNGDRLRRELQAICEHVLGVSPIGWSENLLGLGADSLALLNLLLEIEGYAGRPMPLSTFLSAQSVEALATVLSIGAEAMAAQQAGWGQDEEPVCRFLDEPFPRVERATIATLSIVRSDNMPIPMISLFRSKLALLNYELRRLYFVVVWKMDIKKGTRISLSAKLDKVNPSGMHIGQNTAVAFRSAILAHDFVNGRFRDVFIGDNCLIGAGSVIMPGVQIGDNCIVSPNSVVLQNVPAGSIVMGNPAKIVLKNIITGPWGTRGPIQESSREKSPAIAGAE
ncbi:acetoacetate--CoA ligase [Bradyrhizobium sp. CCBAU 53340]|uniref:acetoacetate--CoA ligase n=1 Tax=Bradyrhizobium sp. CCBAU 53340 TaxID=1325112 RepID=UPI00188BC109|nr:acetoacetate--CoA ligase [Bradyrhizobium sp. CCBAU 53340]QOZ46247.1 acetoacetate--CoA ligase [Bradyrhizobium sp. CCBAU 53340]